jgi:3,4-dihydroxy-2-butanone 4-phosphate synthase
MALSPIPEILDELRAGRVIVLVDDEQRENEGDFVCAAEKVTPQVINFMTRIGGGYLCVALAGKDCDRLDLAPQATANTALHGTALTVSVDGHPRHGVGTGVSAPDRNKTIQLDSAPDRPQHDRRRLRASRSRQPVAGPRRRRARPHRPDRGLDGPDPAGRASAGGSADRDRPRRR